MHTLLGFLYLTARGVYKQQSRKFIALEWLSFLLLFDIGEVKMRR